MTDPTHESVFDSLSEQELKTLFDHGATRTMSAGDVILKAGEPGDSFYILVSGTVSVEDNGKSIAKLNTGALFGEMCLFNENIRTFDVVVASTEIELLEVESIHFFALFLNHESMAVKFMSMLGSIMLNRLKEHDNRLEKIVEPDPLNKKLMLENWALKYHEMGHHGKLEITSSKPVRSQEDLSVAYSPGVSGPSIAISKDPELAYLYTAKEHLVGVITNGSAVLGHGNIGALGAKPVMEGKAVLFKGFADLDAFDIEVNESDPDKLIDIICAISPTFGGINLEDIKSPECFYIEKECQRRLDIPVFHDDQHGTAIVAGAGILNALEIVNKRIDNVHVVMCGAGSAGFTCAKYFINLGVKRENLLVLDVDGVVYKGRSYPGYLDEVAATTNKRTLAEAVENADVFVGLSTGNLLTPDMLLTMNANPIVFAMANPNPEIDYTLALQTRDDVIIGTGRSDYPNQVNNVMAFPFIFRGALDVRASVVNESMKLAATQAIAALAKQPVPENESLQFGTDYILPKPFDKRLLLDVPLAVAEAAMQSNVARVPIDLEHYREKLESARNSLLRR